MFLSVLASPRSIVRMGLQRRICVLGFLLGSSCAPPSPSLPPRPPAPHAAAAPAIQAVRYSTNAAAFGVIGGAAAQELEVELAAELARRGNIAVADGALAATASWILDELANEHPLDQTSSEATARRNGFVGVVLSMAGFELRAAQRSLWRDAIARVPANMPITRYGIKATPDGRAAAVVFGNVEVSLADFPSHFALNESVELRGEVGPRFAFARIFLTKPDGSVEQKVMTSRAVDGKFSLASNGTYKLEVMGDGDTGPVIVANVPLWVGAVASEHERVIGRATTPAQSELRLFELLNQSRAVAHLPALMLDEPLHDVAFGHSTDMAEHDFFGHVSPTTGDPEARLRRAGVVVSAYGENIAQADSPENAHDSLMSSPGHRAVMLGAQFTHVGIAAVPAHSALVYTLVFARRAAPEAMLHNAVELQAAFLALRAKNGLSKPVPDDIYRVAAEAGLAAYASAVVPSSELAVSAMHAALVQEVQRRHASRAGSCSFVGELIDPEQLAQNSALLAPGVRRFGLAAQPRADGKALLVMMVLEGAPCG
ncbi:MAG TPA: CAP domain-containing protein [Polyangiaceae bacterium]|nr:CAP domain-containing protein [Polyangiaceae bacterium]